MNFKKYTKKVGLTKQEKNDLYNNIATFVTNNPLITNSLSSRQSRWEQKNIFLLIFNSKPMIASLIAAILIALSGGTAAAAENTVPGDLLYPVKININEEVRSALSLTPQSKVNWDNRRAERRLEETEKLANENKLTTTTSNMLAEKFEEFSNKASVRIEKLQANGKLTAEQVQNIKENFEVAIKAHDEVLSRIQEREQEKTKLDPIINSLHNQASSTIKERIKNELRLVEENSSSTLKIVAENRKNAANNKISEVEKFITENTDKTSAENKTMATKKLDESRALIVSGDTLYNENKYGEAIIKYTDAHRTAQEAKKYISSSFRLEKRIDVVTSTPTNTSSTPTQQKFNKERVQNIEQHIREEIQTAKDKLTNLRNEIKEQRGNGVATNTVR